MQLIDWSSSVHKLLDAFNGARDKHRGLKDVDDKFVDSLHSLAGEAVRNQMQS